MKEINGVIREDVIVTDSDGGLKLGSEVRFEGGVIRYTGIGTLNVYGGGVIDNEDDVNDGITYGEGGTNIVAGDYQIFYGNAFAFKGKWSIKGIAYASWFGLENTADRNVKWVLSDDSEGSEDSGNLIRVDMLKDNSVSINTAIRLKGQGEVRLPMGKYGISHHISMPEGIQLIGAGSDIDGMVMGTVLFPFVNTNADANYTYKSSYEIAVSTMNENKINLSNIPFPLPTDGFDSSDTSLLAREFGYMIVINIQDEISVESAGKVITYFYNVSKNDNRHRSTLVANIDLSYKGDDNYNHQYKGILFEGGVEFYNVRSYGLVQFCGNAGIMYSDDRVIRNCCFGLNALTDYDTITTKLYAFDLKGLGDAMLFMGNHAASYHPKIGSLRIDSCKGGVLEGNILNSDVMINQCCGVTFNGNHCEYGIKLDVRGSSVSICDNIFWKGAHPTIRIRRVQYPKANNRQVVTLRNNMFSFYMKNLSNQKEPKPHNMSTICDYDVVTDGCANIVIENCFRSRFYDDVNEFSPTGIKVGLLKMYEEDTYYWDVNEVSDLPEFNNYSHINSLQSVVSGQRVSSAINGAVVLGGTYGWLTELSESSLDENKYKNYYSSINTTVKYRFYEVFDFDRCLGQQLGEEKEIVLRKSASVVNMYMPKEFLTPGNIKMLRIIRNIDGVYSSVCVPLCGALELTDDRVSVNGYQWVEHNHLLLVVEEGVTDMIYKDKNIECTLAALPVLGTWRTGDVAWIGSSVLTRYERKNGQWYKTTTTSS